MHTSWSVTNTLFRTDIMTSIRILAFLLLLLLHQVYSEEDEPAFKAEGGIVEIGYCFGVDYIVVYRCAPEGDQLLGNSSADNTAVTPPADLLGRIHINKQQYLLGLQIRDLTLKDTGVYRRECWENQTLISQHMQQVFVCNQEVEPEGITVKEEDGVVKLLCNNTSIGLEGISVRWYHETLPLYKPTLFLDSSVSLDPLVEELKSVIEVRHNGALLLLENSTLKNNQHFICVVIKGETCLSFQTMHLPDNSESWDIFASHGDRVVLKCPSEGRNQQWETPLGKINGSSVKMNISFGDKSEDFSLVIPAFSDELSGHYSCFSSTLEVQYLLVNCPKKETHEVIFTEGGSVVINCHVGKDDNKRVQWHRREPSGENELIHDSEDKTVPIPEDLRGRLTLSESGSSLTITPLEVKDQGVYWCIVLNPTFLDVDYDFKDDYNWEGTEEDEFTDGFYWYNTPQCIFKQETILRVATKKGRGVALETVTVNSLMRNQDLVTTTDLPAATDVTALAVGAALVGLLVIGATVAVIALKRRAKALSTQRGTASRSELNMTKDIKRNVDPGCTERLTHNDEHGA